MSNAFKLSSIKLIHTVIWLFFVTTIGYVLYSSIANRITIQTCIAIGLVIVEGGILLAFKGRCPLTIVARNYSNSDRDNFDIFLPNWLARYNKLIFTVLYVIGLMLVAYRWLHQE